MNNIDSSLAVDLSKSKDSTAVDLSKEAIAKRDHDRRMKLAASKARKMNRAFKGILGAPKRRQHIQHVIDEYDLDPTR